MRITYSIFATLIGILLSQAQAKGICRNREYYSDFSNRCETASLQVGHADSVQIIRLTTLKARFETVEMVIGKNPGYEKNGTVNTPRKYKGFLLRDILQTLLPKDQTLDQYVLAATFLPFAVYLESKRP